MSNWHVDARDYSLWNIIHLRCNAFRKSTSFSGLRRTGLICFLWLKKGHIDIRAMCVRLKHKVMYNNFIIKQKLIWTSRSNIWYYEASYECLCTNASFVHTVSGRKLSYMWGRRQNLSSAADVTIDRPERGRSLVEPAENDAGGDTSIIYNQ